MARLEAEEGDPMTLSAWLMMGATWSVVAFLTIRFLSRVLGAPPGKEKTAVRKDER